MPSKERERFGHLHRGWKSTSDRIWCPVIKGGGLQASASSLRLCGNLGKKARGQRELPLPHMGTEKQRMGTECHYHTHHAHLVSQNLQMYLGDTSGERVL